MAKYRFSWREMEQEVIRPDYSTTNGGTLTGKTIEVGYYRMPDGTGAKRHSHPNEQIISILQGKMQYNIGGEEGVAEAGDVLHIPPNTEHQTQALEDVVFISSKGIVEGRGSRGPHVQVFE